MQQSSGLYLFCAVLLISLTILSAAEVTLEETGHSVGVGNHTIEVTGGNLTGNVTGWHVIRCNTTGMWELDL